MKSIEQLVKKLQKLSKHNIWINATFHEPSVITTINEKDNEYQSITYSLVDINQLSNFSIYRKSDKYSFIYYDRRNLWYDNHKNRRVILDYPSYNAVYDFLYTYYINPFNLNKDKYISLNEIFKGK